MHNQYLEELEKRMEENTSMQFDAILDRDNEKLEALFEEAKQLNAEYDALMKPTMDVVGMLGREYMENMDSRSNEDYIANQLQMDKFLEVLAFFIEESKNNSCKIKSVSLEPKEENAGLTAQYILFDVWGKSLERFGKILKHISALSVNATLSNEIEVSLTVPRVFMHKDEIEH